MSKMDVAVLGGGPAGLAAALALRQRGCLVGLYDAQHPPIDKACGEGLMPESVRLLRGLGIALDSEDGAGFAGISFHDASSAAHGTFSQRHRIGSAPHTASQPHGSSRGRDGNRAALGLERAGAGRRWLCGGRARRLKPSFLSSPMGFAPRLLRRRVSANSAVTVRATPAGSRFDASHGATT